MGRFVKDDVMARVSSVQQLLKIDVGLKENHKVYSRIDIGFIAEKSLNDSLSAPCPQLLKTFFLL